MTNPNTGYRQLPNSAMTPMTGAPTTYTSAPPATIHPTALALLSSETCLPTIAKVIGVTIAKPTPLRE